MKTLKYICLISLLFTICSCSSCKKEKEEPHKPTPLNISVLIDLSDRITKTANNVEQQKKDVELITYIVNGMKDKVVSSKFVSQDKFQILFYPDPKLDSISEISSNLRLDMHCATLKDRPILKQKLKSLDSLFSTNLNLIYNKTKTIKDYPGSDIWGFFENKVQEYCIKNGHRNVLVILTDGYIYHKDNTIQKGNKYNYVTSRLLSANPNSRLLNPLDANEKLDDLEVLMIELNPNPQNQEKLLKNVLSQWLDEMGVKKYKLLSTDLSSNIKPSIDEFIFNK